MEEHFQPKRIKTKKSEALWMTTMADLSFLLMSFFALLLSFSKPNKQEFDNVVSNMNNQQKGQVSTSLQTMAKDIESAIVKQNLSKEASVRIDVDGLVLEFSENLVFTSGSAKPSVNFADTVGKVLHVLSTAPDRYRLTLEGHTDDVPLRGKQGLASNWELSAARGISLLNTLKERGISPQRMRILAYADTQPKIPILGLKGSALDDARRANRRVVIRLE